MTVFGLRTENLPFQAVAWLLLIFVLLVLGIGLATLPLALAIALVVGTLVLLITAIRLEWGFYLLILAIPFGSLIEMSLGILSIGASEALVVGLVLLWFVDMAVRRRVQFPSTPLLLPLSVFLGIIALSIFSAISLEQSLKGMLLWLEFALIYLLVVAKIVPSEVKGLVLAVFAAGVGQALLGSFQFFTGEGPESFQVLGRFIRAYGTFGQPNPFGGYLGLIFPLALGIALGQGWGRGRGLFFRGLASIVAAILMVGIIFSWSRGAWLATVGALAAMTLLGIWSKSFSPLALAILGGGIFGALAFFWGSSTFSANGILSLAVGLGSALGGGALFYLASRGQWIIVLLATLLFVSTLFWGLGMGQLIPGVVSERFLDFIPYLGQGDVRLAAVNDENYAVLERLALWQAAGQMVRDRPWLGVGIGNYVAVYPGYALPGWDDPLGHAHNYYLHIAAETGIPGLLAYLGLWIAAFGQGLRLLFRGPSEQRGLVLGILGMIVTLSLHNMVDNLYVQGMNLQMAIFLGTLAALEKEKFLKPGEV